MTHEELAKRKPVWAAMSDLFLDTETRWSVPHVALRCAESGYDDEALERIFWAEVFPEGIGNLTQVAGEWAVLELDEAALIKRANSGSIPWLTRRAHGAMVQDEWLGVREVTAWLRAYSGEERTKHLRALDTLGRRYFEEPETETSASAIERVKELNETARLEWKRYEAVCQRMLLANESPHGPRAEQVVKLLG
jgi:hypothetical protein